MDNKGHHRGPHTRNDASPTCREKLTARERRNVDNRDQPVGRDVTFERLSVVIERHRCASDPGTQPVAPFVEGEAEYEPGDEADNAAHDSGHEEAALHVPPMGDPHEREQTYSEHGIAE